MATYLLLLLIRLNHIGGKYPESEDILGPDVCLERLLVFSS